MINDNGMKEKLLESTAKIVSSCVDADDVSVRKLPKLIETVYSSLKNCVDSEHVGGLGLKPAVDIDKSVGKDFIVCLEDGKKMKMLRRYLKTKFGMEPDEYRKKWGLPFDYPMVAPSYAKKRSKLAKSSGLGQ